MEIGCGNGRDAHYFASRGRAVMALDQSAEAIRLVNESADRDSLDNLRAAAVGVGDLAASRVPGEFRRELSDGRLAVYARFLVHAIVEDEQALFLDWLSKYLREGEYCYLEFRAAELSGDQYEFGSHYRRPVTARKLAEQCEAIGFEVISSTESDGFAPYHEERPLVGRTVLRQIRD